MTVVDVLEVQAYPLRSDQLQGHHLDEPVARSQTDLYSICIGGWVLGQSPQDVIAVEVVHNGLVIRRTSINVRRPDVAAVNPKVPEAELCGFRTAISLIPIEPETQQVLLVQAVLRNESRVTIGAIFLRRHRLRRTSHTKLQPLILNTLGRSGSTWLTQLLSQHPQVIAYQPFRYEPRVASYWMEVLRTLLEPASYLQAVLTEVHEDDHYWWIGDNKSSAPLSLASDDPVMWRWLGRDVVEDLVELSQNRIEAFYRQVSDIQGKRSATYFAERFYGTSPFAMRMMWELYPRTREVFLVRDLRDVLCSMFAFREKTGTAILFGYDEASDDNSFAHQLGGHYRNLLNNWQERSNEAYLLRYEDLILNPEETLAAFLDYLELDSRGPTVQHVLQTATEIATEYLSWHQTSASQSKSIERWRRDLSPSLQAVCQRAFGDVLKEFGYPA